MLHTEEKSYAIAEAQKMAKSMIENSFFISVNDICERTNVMIIYELRNTILD